MRIGILPFGTVSDGDAYFGELIERLRSADIDVITAESPVTSLAAAGEAGAQISRADCDGVVLFVWPTMERAQVRRAILELPSPLLLAGPHSPYLCDAAGTLAEIGIAFDRYTSSGVDAVNADADALTVWLRENRKQERHRGIEAARKLYGLRFSLRREGELLDPAQWQRQFGITLVGAAHEADVVIEEEDANATLTQHLLTLISGTAAERVTMGTNIEQDATLAQLARRRGRFVCFLLRGPVNTGDFANTLLGGSLVLAPGDHVGAVKAACEALDIDVIAL